MLEGLEVSVINLGVVREDNRVFRYDTQYYSKAALAIESKIKRGKWDTLENLADGVESFGAYALTNEFTYQETGIPFLRCVNIRGGFADFGDVIYIDAKANELLAKSEVKPGMLLLTMSGSVGNATVALESWNYPVNSNQDIAKITPKSGINPFYLTAFLGSKFGQIQMERLPVGSVQQHIFLWMIEGLAIARLSPQLQEAIGCMVREAYEHEADSVTIGSKSVQTLLRALGLEGWERPEPLTYTRRASEALAAARLDAEHFRPKFAALLSKMREHGKVVRLGDCVRFCERGRQPQYAEEGLPVINSRHVRANNVVLDEDNRFATEDAAQLKLDEEDRFTIKQGDLLINGTGVGTMGRCAPYLREDKALPDNHVTILRMKPEIGLEPIFLSVQLNSIIGQMQVEQYFKGSSGQIELYPSEIKEFRIWLAPPKIQEQIKSHLEQAHHSRQEAQTLLAKAKRAVEVAIEESESAALNYLKEI